MGLDFREHVVLDEPTNIELFKKIDGFIERMEVHMEKYPNYNYTIEPLGGVAGSYRARIIIRRYDNKKTELAQGDSSSYGVL